jgi:glycolate oxidase iron-sulfur subunit
MHKDNTPKECVLCGRCLEVCPIFQVTQREELSPRGKGFLLGHYHEFDIGDKKTIELAELCVGCRRCLGVCPQKIDLPLEIARLKSVHPDWKARIWARIIKSGPSLLPAIKGTRAIIPRSAPLLKHLLLTKPPLPTLFKVSCNIQDTSKQAVIFPGCVGRQLRPELEKKAVRLLSMLGYEVHETPDWQCCGYPLGSAGLFEQEKMEMAGNVQLWQSIGKPEIFTFCATCLYGLKDPFGSFDEPDSWQAFRQSVRSLTLELLKFDPLLEPLLKKPSLLWHEPCHGTGDSEQIIRNFMKRAGLDLTILNKKCCGMGGSFALQHPGLSAGIAEDFWQSADCPQNTLVLSDCNGCVLQLDATKPHKISVAHWLEIISPGE